MKLRKSRCPWRVVLFGLLAFLGEAGFLQHQPAALAEEEGLDLVLLIDMSRSMYTSTPQYKIDNPPTGSDPERLRWDAVKIVLDLMNVHDRLAVLTFNHGCPADYSIDRGTEQYEILTSGLQAATKTGASRFVSSSQGFPDALRRLTDQVPNTSLKHGARLLDAVRIHNTNADVLMIGDQKIPHGLDLGGTNIAAALQRAAKLLRAENSQQSRARQAHVILLTDGVDDAFRKVIAGELDFKKADASPDVESARVDEILAEIDDQTAVGQWIAVQIARFRHPQAAPIRVHTLGLNLKEVSPQYQPAARRFLQQLSIRTQGVPREIETAQDLIPFVRDLLRDVRGYWSQECTIAAGQRPQKDVTVGGRLQDVTVMTYGTPANSTPKQKLRAPAGQPSGWVAGTTDAGGLVPETFFGIEHGQNRGLYRLDRFARTAGRPELPFARKWPVDAVRQFRFDFNAEAYPQSQIVFKAPLQEPFQLDTVPTEWRRYQPGFEIAVRMIDAAAYQPQDFRVTVRCRRITEGTTEVASSLSIPPGSCEPSLDSTLPPMTFELKPTEENPRLFARSFCLDELIPATAKAAEQLEFTVTIDGLAERPHLLQGMRRTMLPVQVTVRDEPLELRTDVSKLVLTTAKQKTALKILPSGCLFHRPPMRVTLVPPQPEQGEPLKADDFLLRVDGAPATEWALAGGGSDITVSLREDRNETYQRIPHRAGQLKVEQRYGENWQPRFTIPLDLILQKIPVQLTPTPLPLVAASEPVRSAPIKVMALNADDLQIDRPVEIVLAAWTPDADAEPDEGALAAKPAKFPPAQLWLQLAGEQVATLPDSRRQRITLPLGKAFSVWFHPTEQPELGRYRYELRTTGSEVGGTRATGDLAVQPPKVEIVDQQPISLFGDPGEVIDAPVEPIEGEINLRLQQATLNTPQSISLLGADDEPTSIVFTPEAANEASQRFRLQGPTSNLPVMLPGPSRSDQPAPTMTVRFQLFPPRGMKIGRYKGSMTIVGPAIEPVTVRLQLLMDQLVLELPSFDVDQPPWFPWPLKSATPMDPMTEPLASQFVQFEDQPGRRRLRVRRAFAGAPPLDATDLHADFQGELKSADDIQPIAPKLVAAPVADGNGAVMTVEFPGVKHFNPDRANPYTIRFVVQPRAGAVAAKRCPPFRPVERRFEVQYVRVQDLLGQSPR